MNSPQTPALDEIVENFELIDDWEERYRYLIELGRKLPPLPDEERREEHRVRGCTSQVWLISERTGDHLSFRGDSDAHIVRGLVALLLAACSGQKASTILALDIDELFRRLGLESHLSVSRRNGFFSMVSLIRASAQEVLQAQQSDTESSLPL